jgi:hypothetical protein
MSLVALAVPARAERFRFPLADDCATSRCAVVTAYRDVGMVQDFSCGDHTYAGHKGTDFAIIGGFTAQDEGRTIVAAAAGTVEAVSDGAMDRCTTGDCPGGGGFGNYVSLRHADGELSYYAHMRMGSIQVAEGQAVTCGQPLGLVGSSGHSTGPHCHFELRASDATTRLEPFTGACASGESRWTDQGAYRELPWTLCAGALAPACTPAADLVCGSSTGATASAPSAIADYACGRTVELSGPERVYRFVAGATERVELALDGLGADLDLLVLADQGRGCAADGCVAVSEHGDTTAESLAFDAERGRTYYVVIDGFRGADSAYALSARCTQAPDAGPSAPPDAGPRDAASIDARRADAARPAGNASADGPPAQGGAPAEAAGSGCAVSPRNRGAPAFPLLSVLFVLFGSRYAARSWASASIPGSSAWCSPTSARAWWSPIRRATSCSSTRPPNASSAWAPPRAGRPAGPRPTGSSSPTR